MRTWNLKRFLSPVQLSEDAQRKEYILTIYLLCSIILSVITVLIVITNAIREGATSLILYIGCPLAILCFFSLLLFLSRKGHYIFSGYSLIAVYLLSGTLCIYTWGLLLPWGSLVYILAIIMAGAIISTRTSGLVFLYSVLSISVYFFLERTNQIHPDLSWSKDLSEGSDPIVLAFIFCIITLISWLSNTQIEKSLERARSSELALLKERDQLEVKIAERTKDLKDSQQEKLSQLYRFAELGKHTSGILHDLVNPLTAVSLNLEKMDSTHQSDILKRAIDGAKKMEEFITDARNQIRNQSELKIFDASEIILQSINDVEIKSIQIGVPIIFSNSITIEIYGNPARFRQVIINLLDNAIDATKNSSEIKNILVDLVDSSTGLFIRIQDFGEGISENHKKNIFNPFFTTKGNTGTGLGLSLCKEIIEKDFSGEISFFSQKNVGTIFSIEIPHHEYSLQSNT